MYSSRDGLSCSQLLLQILDKRTVTFQVFMCLTICACRVDGPGSGQSGIEEVPSTLLTLL